VILQKQELSLQTKINERYIFYCKKLLYSIMSAKLHVLSAVVAKQFQKYTLRFHDSNVKIPGLFWDFPGLESSRLKFHHFSWSVQNQTLHNTQQNSSKAHAIISIKTDQVSWLLWMNGVKQWGNNTIIPLYKKPLQQSDPWFSWRKDQLQDPAVINVLCVRTWQTLTNTSTLTAI